VRELRNVKYYDDNYSATYPSLDVAVKVFKDYPTILIAGCKDRGLDLTPNKKVIFESPNVKKAILIGETRRILAEGEPEDKYEFADTLEQAVLRAQALAEEFKEPAIVLMSPGAASFDMFKNFSERGELFHKYVEGLK
jgi:UDP-N-acetylmuramoylalanine--D-glutamate ligase